MSYQIQRKWAKRSYARRLGGQYVRLARPTLLPSQPKYGRRGLIGNGNKGIMMRLRHVTFSGVDGLGNLNDQVKTSLVTSATNYTQLSGMYDAFAVKAIKAKYIPINVGAEALGTAGSPYVRGTVIKLTDPDGTNLPTTVASAIEYGGAKSVDPRKTITNYHRINKMWRSQLNDFNTGWNTQNKDATLMLVGDAFLPFNTNFFIRTVTFYVTCYGCR